MVPFCSQNMHPGKILGNVFVSVQIRKLAQCNQLGIEMQTDYNIDKSILLRQMVVL